MVVQRWVRKQAYFRLSCVRVRAYKRCVMAEHLPDKKDGWQRYDWALIECVYVCSIPGLSLRQIAKKYGCNLKTVARHSKKDDWFRKRCDFLSQVVRKSYIELHMSYCEGDVLEVVNEDRIAHGLEPLEKLTPFYRKLMREEIEKLY